MNATSRALGHRSSWLPVLAVSAGVAAVFYAWSGASPELWVDHPASKSSSTKWRASMALADTALTLLSIALLIGPIRVLRGGTPTIHLPLRRRVGLVAAAFGAAHLVVGISMHGDLTRPWISFAPTWPATTRSFPVPFSLLGLGNWFGLAVAVALVAPVATSNRPTMRRLRTVTWKRLQRFSYVAYALLVGHVVLYQQAERRWIIHRVVILTIVVAVLTAQLAAFVVARRRSAPSRTTEATETSEPRRDRG